MADLTLVIGNKNYSSWSLRPWLFLKHNDIQFEEVLIPLYEASSKARLLEYSPAGLVPTLLHGDKPIWDSLAILEFLAESFPAVNGWPEEQAARAHARSVSAEMHSGFSNIRNQLPMNCRRKIQVDLSPEVELEVARIISIWEDCLNQYGGPFLFGEFTIADAMYAPVVLRFDTYGVPTHSEKLDRYQQQILSLHAMKVWLEGAAQETEIIEAAEV